MNDETKTAKTITAPDQNVAFAWEMIRTGRKAELIEITAQSIGGNAAKAIRAATVMANFFERKLSEAIIASEREVAL